MSTSELLLQELEQEATVTRRVLERVPPDRLSWRPHDKSMSLGQLALHIASLPGAVAEMSQLSPFPLPDFTPATPTSAAEILPTLEASLERARAIVGPLDDASMSQLWRLVEGDREIMALPVGVLLRSLMLNHWYHHRGQLCVYLRQVGALVPAVYGRSADENPFGSISAATAAL